ncbi:MAG: diacylglycerol kinase [Janthinobacterium lividum]
MATEKIAADTAAADTAAADFATGSTPTRSTPTGSTATRDRGPKATAKLAADGTPAADEGAALPHNPYKVNRGLTRAWHALRNSLSGFQIAVLTESAFRQELSLSAIMLPIGALLPVPGVERVLLLGSVLLVLIVELLNSSVEAAIDRISLAHHELSRRAKDLGSAAVMVALLLCLMTWTVLLTPHILKWLQR